MPMRSVRPAAKARRTDARVSPTGRGFARIALTRRITETHDGEAKLDTLFDGTKFAGSLTVDLVDRYGQRVKTWDQDATTYIDVGWNRS